MGISGQDLFNEREQIKQSLHNSSIRAYENGIECAEKTRAYRILLRQVMLMLKEEGIAATNVEKIAKGCEDVAQAEFEMNVAEVKYRASNENIMIQKKLLDSIEGDIDRELRSRGD